MLHDKIDRDSLQHLIDLNIGARCGDMVFQWEQQRREEAKARENAKKEQRTAAREQIKDDIKSLEASLPFWLAKQTSNYYTSVTFSF